MRGWLIYFSAEDNVGQSEGHPIFVPGRKRRAAIAAAVSEIRQKRRIKGKLTLHYVFKKTRKGRGCLPPANPSATWFRKRAKERPTKVKRHPCRLG